MRSTTDRIHLIAHAGGARPDLERLGYADARDMLASARAHLPSPYRLTADPRFFEVRSDEFAGGRRDDAARAGDLQNALDDPLTRAIVAANGGAYLTRILPDIDFSPLARRRSPLWIFGFSEITTLVNIFASYRCGRGVYWLCPHYLAWKLRPAAAARRAVADFWCALPELLHAGSEKSDLRADDHEGDGTASDSEFMCIANAPLLGRLVSGRVREGDIRLVGGCLSVFCALLAGPFARRLRPDGHWLFLEDINEEPYRLDRYFAILKLAGWFERVEGLLLGDFHTRDTADQQPLILELLRFHLPRQRRLPIVLSDSFGHRWPMRPVWLNRQLRLRVRRGEVTIETP